MNRVALITGASRGIGRSIALAFARHGYSIGINFARSKDKAEAVAREIGSLGGKSLLLEADVSNSEQVKKMVGKVMGEWGKIDVLVNNAGITRDRTILKMSDEEWLETIQVNLTGAFWCLRECAKEMCRKKEGAILNISSIVGAKGSSGNANYVASKAGLMGLTKAAARELGRFNVRVNSLLPGFHRTDMGNRVWDKLFERVRSEHFLGKLTDLEEFAEFVCVVAEQKSVSGQVYNFDSRIL